MYGQPSGVATASRADRERTAAEQQQQLVGVVVGRTVAAAQAARA